MKRSEAIEKLKSIVYMNTHSDYDLEDWEADQILTELVTFMLPPPHRDYINETEAALYKYEWEEE